MSLKTTISAGSLAMALSLGGLGLALQGCASSSTARGGETAMKGGDKSCGASSCSGDKGAEKSCGETTAKGADKSCGETNAKGADKSCGEGSCG